MIEDPIVQFLHAPSGCTLWAPASFLSMSEATIETIYNGCGPRGWLGRLIPESLFGLSITFLCYIHDHMYERCCCEADEDVADAIFAANLTRWIIHHSKWYNKLPRLLLAARYINAVASTVYSTEYWKKNLMLYPRGCRYAVYTTTFGGKANDAVL